MKRRRQTLPEHCYRVMLRLYPRSFRDRYQDEMLQTFRDLQRDQGTSPQAMWSRLVADLIVSLFREHIRKINNPRPWTNIMKTPANLKPFAAILGLGLSLGLLYTAQQPGRAPARTIVRVKSQPQPAGAPINISASFSTEDLGEVGRRLNLQERWLSGEVQPPPLSVIAERLRTALKITPIPASDLISIEATGIEIGLGQQIIGELLKIAAEKTPDKTPRWHIIQTSSGV